MAVRREYIADLYRNMLGREGSEGEISGWENAPDEQSVYNMFAGSPEYTSTHGGTATWQDVGGVITPSQPSGGDGGGGGGSSSPYQIQDDPSFPGGGTIYPNPGSTTGGGIKETVGGSPQDQVTAFYKKYLGRDPQPGDVEKWLAGTYGWGSSSNLAGIEAGIRMSEEAARQRAANPGTSYPTTPYTGFTPNYDYSAFNTARQQDPRTSAKDAFAMVTNSAPAAPMNDKSKLPAWFNTYIRPGFEALGHKVLSVDQDGFVYSNQEGTFRVDYVQNAGAAGSTPGAPQRFQWGATPADAATAARYAAAPGTAATTGTRAPTSAVSNVRSLSNLTNLGNLGAFYGGPGGAGITNGPLEQVGQDPLSQLITGALAQFIGNDGSTAFGGDVEDALRMLMARGGELDPDQMNRRYESARELLDKGRRTMVNDMRGDLASRNLLSEPGIPQGAEIGGLERITEHLAPEFSRALRDIYSDEAGRSDDRLMNALSMATGYSSDQARNLLAAIGEGTARQTALAGLSLDLLKTNMAWSQFLASFGLERDKVMYEMENGQIDQFMPLLQAFIQMAGLSNAGFT